MNIAKMKIADLVPADYNPRVELQPGDPDYERLENSLDEFSCVRPPVFNRTLGRLVSGHQTLHILRAKGVVEVDTVVVDIEDETREKALNLALNKISGRWDTDRLAQVLEELDGVGLAGLAGYTEKEVERLLKRAEQEIIEAGEIDPGEFAEAAFDHKCPRCGYLY